MKRKSGQTSFDVFLSHSAKDREFVMRLATDLADAGLRVWLDQWNIKPGDSFAVAIDQAIRASRFLLIVMSPDYFQSAWTTQEWQYALADEIEGGGVRLIPILYRDCDIPPMLRTKQWVDFRDKAQYRAVLDRLVHDLQSLASSSEAPARTPTEAPKPGERVEELDPTTVSELKKVLQDAVAAFRTRPDTPPSLTTQGDLTNLDEEMCFIIMPFAVESLNIVYEDL